MLDRYRVEESTIEQPGGISLSGSTLSFPSLFLTQLRIIGDVDKGCIESWVTTSHITRIMEWDNLG